MHTHAEDLSVTWQRDLQALFHPRVLGRMLLLALLSNAAALLMGIAFFVIWQGISYGLFRLAIYWSPLYRAVARVLGAHIEPDLPQWRFAPITAWQVPGLVLRIAVTVLFVGVGFWLLIRLGLCRQNIICLLAQSSRPAGP